MNIGKLARLLCVLLLAAPLQATAVTYVMDTIVANWIDSSTHNKITTVSAPYKFTGTGCGTAPPTLDDVISDSIPIGFNFMYGGVVFSNLRVMSNGRLQFGNTTCGSGTQSIGPPQTFPYGYPDANMNYTMRIYGGDLDATLKKKCSNRPPGLGKCLPDDLYQSCVLLYQLCRHRYCAEPQFCCDLEQRSRVGQ